MAVVIRRAILNLANVTEAGDLLDKNSPTTTIRDMLNFQTQLRVFPTGGAVSSPNAPPTGIPLDDYLAAEAAEDFQVVLMNQSMIVTQKIT